MDESEPQKENPNGQNRRFDLYLLKKGLRCDLDQYEMLKRCSEKGEEGIKEWNEWRSTKENRHKDIYLEGAPLDKYYFKNIHLQLKGVEYNGEWSGRKGTSEVFLREANLRWANLKSAALMGTHLEGAKIWFAHLEDADVSDAHLESTECRRATVDSTTSLWECKVDRKTDFLGVSLDAAKIDPGTKQLLEYNIRRKNWEDWYPEQHWLLAWLVRKFWQISDYGISTKRIIITFFGLALIFANIYYHWGRIAPPGIVENLFEVQKAAGEVVVLPTWLVPLRTLYFSIVTMTTLGFGDMYANAHSIWGHILLSLQVILGYVLLGALVTRFAVLFTAGGPAGKFSNDE